MQLHYAGCDVTCIVVAHAAKRCDQAAFIARRLLGKNEILRKLGSTCPKPDIMPID
jgi:hypothetical protein